MTRYLKHISRGKDHRNGFVFLTRCMLRAFQSRLSVFFDRKNSFSCRGQCGHGGQPERGASSRNSRAKAWKQMMRYRQHFVGQRIIPLFTLRPPATSAGLQGGREHRVTESQNHRIVGVGRDLCGSSSPTLLPKQGHLQQAAQDLVHVGLEYLQRRRLHNLPGQPGPGLRHPQREEVLPHVQTELPVLEEQVCRQDSLVYAKTQPVTRAPLAWRATRDARPQNHICSPFLSLPPWFFSPLSEQAPLLPLRGLRTAFYLRRRGAAGETCSWSALAALFLGAPRSAAEWEPWTAQGGQNKQRLTGSPWAEVGFQHLKQKI